MKARRSTPPNKVFQVHQPTPGIAQQHKEMLKMKIDPTMCMKTKVSRQNVMPNTPLFARKCANLARNRGKADVFLQENGRENSNRSGHIEHAGRGWKNWVGQSLPDEKSKPKI
jgi:late competence protein required for DNA uptake (superfamily II DNA/RNA helicase)